jgi:phenylpropionate dioxygenase-like ring-hydroxylating dioxygenase large terminal subunit
MLNVAIFIFIRHSCWARCAGSDRYAIIARRRPQAAILPGVSHRMTLLTRTEPSLPGTWYYDPAHYDRELEAIWYRDWICVGRASDIARPGDYFTFTIGTQTVFVTRDRERELHAFHNTCRHRGSVLCTEPAGHFTAGRIVCPYHAWTYSLAGDLIATPVRIDVPDFRRENYPLHAAQVGEWGGFVFVNLSATPTVALEESLGAEAHNVAQWPLAELECVHRETTQLACNWKVFWENYSECYHCPQVHPELCRVVPLYKEGILNYADREEPAPVADDTRARVAPGFATWTLDGRATLPPIAGPDDHSRSLGMVFASFAATLFVVAHPDYVRSVRVRPTGPESVELTVDWLLPPGVAGRFPQELEHMLALGRLVVQQDGRACELNQRGLRNPRHERGVLMPQEYGVREFHEWLQARLA